MYFVEKFIFDWGWSYWFNFYIEWGIEWWWDWDKKCRWFCFMSFCWKIMCFKFICCVWLIGLLIWVVFVFILWSFIVIWVVFLLILNFWFVCFWWGIVLVFVLNVVCVRKCIWIWFIDGFVGLILMIVCLIIWFFWKIDMGGFGRVNCCVICLRWLLFVVL